jgi:hypothetical protein
VRPALLDDVPAAQPRQAEASQRARIVTSSDNSPLDYVLDDDDDPDDEDDDDFDEDEDKDDDDEGDDEEEEETWQVAQATRSAKGQRFLDFWQ